MKPTLKCYKCGQQYPRGDIVEYTTTRSKVPHRYCPNCLKIAQDTDYFFAKVAEFYKKDIPWATINNRRNKLRETYGYTDKTIIDCLEYAYNVKGYVVLEKALGIVKPSLVEEMFQYKKQQEYENNKIATAFIDGINNKVEIPRIRIRENTRKKPDWNIDDYFFDE